MQTYQSIYWPALAARIPVLGSWFCECSPAYRFHYKQALSSPSSWISEPPSSIVRTETRSLPSTDTETFYFYTLSSSYWGHIQNHHPSLFSSVYLQGWSEAQTSLMWLHSGPLGSDSTRSRPLLLRLPSLHPALWSQAWTASLKTSDAIFPVPRTESITSYSRTTQLLWLGILNNASRGQ